MTTARKISKPQYNKALKIIESYQKQLEAAAKNKKRTGFYSFLYLLDADGEEDFRERLIKAKKPHSAVNKFMRNAPISLRWLDEELEMNGESYYIGDHPAVLNYL